MCRSACSLPKTLHMEIPDHYLKYVVTADGMDSDFLLLEVS